MGEKTSLNAPFIKYLFIPFRREEGPGDLRYIDRWKGRVEISSEARLGGKSVASELKL